MKDRSDDPSHHKRTLLQRRYFSDEFYNSLYTALPSYLATASMGIRMDLQGVGGEGGGAKNITGLGVPNIKCVAVYNHVLSALKLVT